MSATIARSVDLSYPPEITGVRQVVFGAFGCGAFRNPARSVPLIYREQIQAHSADFSVIAVAVFWAGYGPDNYTPFAETFGR